MRYDTFKKLELNKKSSLPCVIIQTGEEGKITGINKSLDKVLVYAKRYGLGIQETWFNYTEVAIW